MTHPKKLKSPKPTPPPPFADPTRTELVALHIITEPLNYQLATSLFHWGHLSIEAVSVELLSFFRASPSPSTIALHLNTMVHLGLFTKEIRIIRTDKVRTKTLRIAFYWITPSCIDLLAKFKLLPPKKDLPQLVSEKPAATDVKAFSKALDTREVISMYSANDNESEQWLLGVKLAP